MKQLIMKNVGDAQHILYSDEKANAMIDCGSKMMGCSYPCCHPYCCSCSPYRLHQYDLVLSHFHYDHYNLLLQACPCWRHLKFDKLYIPAVPSQLPVGARPLINSFLVALQLVTIFKTSTSINSSVFQRIFGRFNQITKLSKGDKFNIGNSCFNVLWPPKTIAAKQWSSMRSDFVKVSDLYDDILQQSPAIKDFAGSLRKNIEMFYQGNDIPSNLQKESENVLCNFPKIDLCLTKKMEKLSILVGSAANHFSLAFDSENMLFLGDLEEKEIDIVCKTPSQDKYDILVAAHHGTHYGKELLNLDVTTTIASVGLKLLNSKTARHAEKVYKGISQYFKQTVNNGDIYITY